MNRLTPGIRHGKSLGVGGLKTRRRLGSRRTPARSTCGLEVLLDEVLLDGGDAGLEVLYLVLDRSAHDRRGAVAIVVTVVYV